MERENRGQSREQIANERLIRSFKRRIFFFGDRQIPDHDPILQKAVLRVIRDYKPTDIYEVGDLINADRVSSYGHDFDVPRLAEEFKEGKRVLGEMARVARTANPAVNLYFLLGNHERRVQKYVNRYAPELADLEKNGEQVLTVPYLLDLKELGYQTVDYWQEMKIDKDTLVFHGDKISEKGGATAQKNIDKFGKSVVAGHTHRLALVFRTQSDEVKFGMETGSLCKRNLHYPYSRKPDWQNGFAFLGVDRDGKLHPTVVPIVDGRFTFGGKIYK